MYCIRKGIECPDCTMFGQCLKTAYCGLLDKYPTTAGSLSNPYSPNYRHSTDNSTVYIPDELYVNGIKYVKEK